MCQYFPGYWHRCPHCGTDEFRPYGDAFRFWHNTPEDVPEYICICGSEKKIWWEFHLPRGFNHRRYCIGCVQEIKAVRRNTGAIPVWFDRDSMFHPASSDFVPPDRYPYPHELYDSESLDPPPDFSRQQSQGLVDIREEAERVDDEQEDSSGSGSTERQFDLAAESHSSGSGSTERQFTATLEEQRESLCEDGAYPEHVFFWDVPAFVGEQGLVFDQGSGHNYWGGEHAYWDDSDPNNRHWVDLRYLTSEELEAIQGS
jgi:hypothetical protein